MSAPQELPCQRKSLIQMARQRGCRICCHLSPETVWYGLQVLLTEDTQKERAARLAALEEGEMLMESPAPSSSTPACPHSSLPQLQSRAPWPQKSPALSSGTYCLVLKR